MAGNDNYLERINEEAASELVAEAHHGRQRFLQLSGIVLRELLETQSLNASFTPEDQPFEYWVRRDVTMAPATDKTIGSTTLSFMLEGYNHFQKRIERLKVLIPTPDDFDQNDPEAIESLPEPEIVFAERLIPPAAENGAALVLSRYAVNRERSYPYVIDGGEMVEKVDDISIEDFLNRPVPEELTRLVRLRLDMVKFKAMPQARVTYGEPVEEL